MEENTKNTVKQAYFYAVSFILLMMMLYSLNSLVWQVIGIVAPPPLIMGQWNYEDTKRQLLWEKYGTTENVTVTPEEIQAFVKEKKEKERQFRVYSLYQGAAKNAISLAVYFPVFLYHWKVVRTLE